MFSSRRLAPLGIELWRHDSIEPPAAVSAFNYRWDTLTWQRLLAVANLASVDHTDLDDAAVARRDGRLAESLRRGEQFGLPALGELHRSRMGVASISVGMSNGVSVMIDQVMGACGGRRLGFLRIYGHGNAGIQIVSAGHGVAGGGTAAHGSALTAQTVRAMAGDWGRLRNALRATAAWRCMAAT